MDVGAGEDIITKFKPVGGAGGDVGRFIEVLSTPLLFLILLIQGSLLVAKF